MSRFILLILLLFQSMLSARAQAPAASPVSYPSLSAALQQAKATNHPVLAVFSGSDWCKPCMMLQQEVFDQPEFQHYAQDKLVLARFDFPRGRKNRLSSEQTKLNEEAAAQLNTEGTFPLVLLLSPEGKVLARTGYRAGGAAAFTAFLQQAQAQH
jgi:uncharacterized protein YyaL (SSP411 family)